MSWIPVTEYCDPDGGFGYLFGRAGDPIQRDRPAIAIDRSDWGDPDYMFLSFVGGSRPGQKCRRTPESRSISAPSSPRPARGHRLRPGASVAATPAPLGVQARTSQPAEHDRAAPARARDPVEGRRGSAQTGRRVRPLRPVHVHDRRRLGRIDTPARGRYSMGRLAQRADPRSRWACAIGTRRRSCSSRSHRRNRRASSATRTPSPSRSTADLRTTASTRRSVDGRPRPTARRAPRRGVPTLATPVRRRGGMLRAAATHRGGVVAMAVGGVVRFLTRSSNRCAARPSAAHRRQRLIPSTHGPKFRPRERAIFTHWDTEVAKFLAGLVKPLLGKRDV